MLIHILTFSVSLLHTHTHTHTQAHTRALSWLLHTASSGEHGFTWRQLRPPAASGLEPNCTEEPGRSKGRLFLPPRPPHSHPIPIPKGDQDPTLLIYATPPLTETKGFHKNQYPTSLPLLDSDFRKPHSFCMEASLNCLGYWEAPWYKSPKTQKNSKLVSICHLNA